MTRNISTELEAIIPKTVKPGVPNAVSDRETVRSVAIDMVVIAVVLAIAVAGTAFGRMKCRFAAARTEPG